VVRATGGQTLSGAKVVVAATAAGEQQRSAVIGIDGKFATEGVAQGPHTVTVQLSGRGPTAPVAVDITSASVALNSV